MTRSVWMDRVAGDDRTRNTRRPRVSLGPAVRHKGLWRISQEEPGQNPYAGLAVLAAA
jgi:hypothetical protein